MNDPNDIFNQENTRSVLYGFRLPTTLDAFYSTKGEALGNDGPIAVNVRPYSTAMVTGFKSSIPVRPGRDPDYTAVFNSTRARSTDFVAVDVEDWADKPAWDYTPIYQGFRAIPGTDFIQFSQRAFTVPDPGGDNMWSVEAHDSFIRLVDTNNAITDINFARSDEIAHLHMAFDENKRPVVTWEHLGKIYIYCYEDIAEGFLVAQAAEGITPFMCQRTQGDQSDLGDYFLVYARQGRLCYRRAIEEFSEEYAIRSSYVASVLGVGVTDLQALVITYFDASVERLRHISTDSSGLFQEEPVSPANFFLTRFSFFTAEQQTPGEASEFLFPPWSSMGSFSMGFQTA